MRESFLLYEFRLVILDKPALLLINSRRRRRRRRRRTIIEAIETRIHIMNPIINKQPKSWGHTPIAIPTIVK